MEEEKIIIKGRYMRYQNLISRNKVLGRHAKKNLKRRIQGKISLAGIHQVINDNERFYQSKRLTV